MTNQLTGWIVYDHPRDYPDCFVARRWIVKGGDVIATADMFTAATLEEVRALLPPGLICFARMPGDDAKIVETWVYEEVRALLPPGLICFARMPGDDAKIVETWM